STVTDPKEPVLVIWVNDGDELVLVGRQGGSPVALTRHQWEAWVDRLAADGFTGSTVTDHLARPIPSWLSLAVCAGMSIPYRRAVFSPKIFRLISKVRSTWYSCFRSSGNSNAMNCSISHFGDQMA